MKRNGLSISLLYTDITPSMEMTLSLWNGLSTKKFQPECVNEKKVLGSFKSYLLLLVAPSGLIDTLAQSLAWRSLLWLSKRGDEGTWHKVISSAQHRWPDLWHYIYCFVSVRSLYGGVPISFFLPCCSYILSELF